MREMDANQRLAEIKELIGEYRQVAKKLAEIERRIAELAGAGTENTRKPMSKTLTAKQWRQQACSL